MVQKNCFMQVPIKLLLTAALFKSRFFDIAHVTLAIYTNHYYFDKIRPTGTYIHTKQTYMHAKSITFLRSRVKAEQTSMSQEPRYQAIDIKEVTYEQTQHIIKVIPNRIP